MGIVNGSSLHCLLGHSASEGAEERDLKYFNSCMTSGLTLMNYQQKNNLLGCRCGGHVNRMNILFLWGIKTCADQRGYNQQEMIWVREEWSDTGSK